MRTIEVSEVTKLVRQLCIDANYYLPADLRQAFVDGQNAEESPLGKTIFGEMIANCDLARENNVPVCQDTGMAIVFAEIGQDVHLTGGSFEDAVTEGVRRGYIDGYLRLSVVGDPLRRENTGDNTPCILYTSVVPGDKVKITEKKGKYTFTMPASKVIIKGKFVEEAPEQIFADVPVDAYCYEAVKWAASEGITGGIGNNLFAPGLPCTRGQIVTFLWRAAGSPAPKSMSSFTDITEDAYYAKAVAWAVENGITGGTGDGKFSPDATCTRAQAVTFLYRASGAPAVSGNAAFSDVAADAYYASAVKWAEKNGITGGIGGGLFGSGNNCTRAQIVTFLYRAMK